MPASMPCEAPGAARVLALRDLVVIHRDDAGGPVPVLNIDGLVIQPGEHLGIGGASGSGKSTLLHVIAGIAPPTAGDVLWGEARITDLPEGERDEWRRQVVGFVFQDFHLVPEMDVLGNILLPGSFASPRRSTPAQAVALADELGLSHKNRRASLLSRGERQRTAVARALIHRPMLILADEPTASLDAANGVVVAKLLVEQARRLGATLICASHDPVLLDLMDRRLTLENGALRPLEPQNRILSA